MSISWKKVIMFGTNSVKLKTLSFCLLCAKVSSLRSPCGLKQLFAHHVEKSIV